MSCEHKNFKAQVDVHRLITIPDVDTPEGEITRYTADVSITCADCHMPFRFKGLQGGVNPSHPTCDVEEIEARMPIEPIKIIPPLKMRNS